MFKAEIMVINAESSRARIYNYLKLPPPPKYQALTRRFRSRAFCHNCETVNSYFYESLHDTHEFYPAKASLLTVKLLIHEAWHKTERRVYDEMPQ